MGLHRRFVHLAAALLVVIVLGTVARAADAQADAQAIWFDALGDQPLELSDADATVLARGVMSRLTETDPPADLPAALARDAQPRIVFVSASDGTRPATVAWGAGFGVLAAASEAANRAAERMPDPSKTTWLKIDLVHSAHAQSIRPNGRVGIDPSLEGLAFDHATQVAMLPQQLVAGELVDGNEIQWGRLIEATTDRGQRAKLRTLEHGRSIECHAFTTQSFYLDGDRAVPLYRGHRRFESVDPATLRDAVVAAGEYLTRIVEPDGAFVYEIDPGTGFVPGEYNMVRHAGTTYAMLELYELTRDPQLLSAAQRALQFMLKSIRTFQYKDQTVAGLISEDGEIKLGGNALAIIAIVQYTRSTNDRTHVEIAQNIGRWIELTQDERGQFTIHKQDPQTGHSGDWESEYYPGEALLALGRLYSIDPQPHWLDSAERAAKYLIQVRDGRLKDDELAHDHWLLYGLAELHQHRKDPLYVAHAQRIAKSIVAQQERDSNVLDWRGGWPRPPRSNPTATRLEGLAATYRLFHDAGQPEQAERLIPSIRAGILFELQLQNRPENVMYYLDPAQALGGIRRNLTENDIRIDDVQHCLSAMLGYLRIIERK